MKPSANHQTQRISRINWQFEQGQSSTKTDFDTVISEEPLQISLQWQNSQQQWCKQVFTITMRTPSDDKALSLGLLYSEGLIQSAADIAKIEFEHANQILLTYQSGLIPQLDNKQRQLISHSSCGLCGKTSLQALELQQPVKQHDTTKTPRLEPTQLGQLPDKLKQQQVLFAKTGSVHGAALFNQDYQLLDIQEDVGRHNAVDKVIGSQLMQSNTDGQILVLSGRVSFELVQKAVVAGYAVIIAVGAPSSLAINAAIRFDVTLIGFTKSNSFNVYHGHWRIKTNDK